MKAWMLALVPLVAGCASSGQTGGQTYNTISFEFSSDNHLRPAETILRVSPSPTEVTTALRGMLLERRAAIVSDAASKAVVWIPDDAEKCWVARKELYDLWWRSYDDNRLSETRWPEVASKHGVAQDCETVRSKDYDDVDGWLLGAEFDDRIGGTRFVRPEGVLVTQVYFWIWREPKDAQTTIRIRGLPAFKDGRNGALVFPASGASVGHDYWPHVKGAREGKLAKQFAELFAKVEGEASWPTLIAAGRPSPSTRTPAPTPLAGSDTKSVVAVFDVQMPADSPASDDSSELADYIATRLAERGSFRVVPRDELRNRLKDSKTKGYGVDFDEGHQIELGKAVAAERMISTRIIKVGDQCAMTSTIFDLKTETTVGAATVRTHCDVTALLDSVDDLLGRLETAGR